MTQEENIGFSSDAVHKWKGFKRSRPYYAPWWKRGINLIVDIILIRIIILPVAFLGGWWGGLESPAKINDSQPIIEILSVIIWMVSFFCYYYYFCLVNKICG